MQARCLRYGCCRANSCLSTENVEEPQTIGYQNNRHHIWRSDELRYGLLHAPPVRLCSHRPYHKHTPCRSPPPPPAATPLFEDNFNNTAKAERSLASIGWAIANAPSISTPLAIPAKGQGNALGVLSASAGTGDTQPGYIWTSVAPGNIRIFTRPVSKLPPLSVGTIGTISFDAVASSSGIVNTHILVQLGGKDWYLSGAELAPVAVGNRKSFADAPAPASVRQTLTFAPAAANWQNLTMTEGSPLAFAPLTADLPADAPVTGIGFLVHNTQTGKGGVVVRIDTLRITGT
ncbi:hypothetical protein [Geminisphaera colitermitum]|uniref:hypothetical protein n=1 Tax=Geminisphaera colitermitum TaxID=1148786 RepID=UPI001E5D7E80|nr:hypothetical protein [Geminisphaera colitermitum]